MNLIKCVNVGMLTIQYSGDIRFIREFIHDKGEIEYA